MKITQAARRFLRVRFIALCVLVFAVAGLELGLGRNVARAIGANRPANPDTLPTPEVTMGDFTTAACAIR